MGQYIVTIANTGIQLSDFHQISKYDFQMDVVLVTWTSDTIETIIWDSALCQQGSEMFIWP